MSKAITSRGDGGEYSTVLLPDGIVETMFFGDDGSSRTVARSKSVERAHREAVEFDRQQVVS